MLRGPQGTLYGRNAFSGAIKLITRTPGADDSWLNAGIGFGSFGETNIGGSIGGDVGRTDFYPDRACEVAGLLYPCRCRPI